ncbi:MAG: halocyanin domain protein [uncultured archaeon A07HB70]|nr:MAG: halocyanin domain protein [uncultured archaeon A07HB70]
MSDSTVSRRAVLRGAAVGAAAATATAGTASAQPSFGGWLSDVTNYSEVVDETGQEEVTVQVGVEANGGAFGFGPAAVQVDPGTTVVWEWTGEGGQHNVVAQSGGDFESELVGDAGFTHEQTLEEEGVVQYYCQPHQSLGMKGVVVVGSVPEEGGGGEGGEGGTDPQGVPGTAKTLGVATAVAMVSVLSLGFFFMKYGGDYETPET